MMVPSIFGENLFDDFFDDFFDWPSYDKQMKDAQKKLYGRRAGNMMKTDVRDARDVQKDSWVLRQTYPLKRVSLLKLSTWLFRTFVMLFIIYVDRLSRCTLSLGGYVLNVYLLRGIRLFSSPPRRISSIIHTFSVVS